LAKLIHVVLALNLEIAYDRQIIHGVRDFLGASKPWLVGIASTVRTRPGSDPVSSLRDTLRQTDPEGIIVRMNDSHVLEAILPLGKKVVNVSGVDESLPVPRVGVENLAVGRAAAAHLLDRSLQHFACITHSGHDNSRKRHAGFLDALTRAGRAAPAHLCVADHPPEMFDAVLRRWLVALPRPVGLYTDVDALALRVTELCRELEIRIPEEIALVSNDNDELMCEFAHPTISSVDLSARRIGFEAAALLDALLRGQPAPAAPLLLPPMGVVARQSSDILAVDEPAVAQAARFIREHAAEAINVGDVVRHVGISRRWLERGFHRALGRSPLDEIRRVRVERAKDLLARTDLPMPDVAARSGFSSAPRLSIVMHAQTGMSPTAYRRQFRLGRPASHVE
jgi:LacI family transcriptional regulator